MGTRLELATLSNFITDAQVKVSAMGNIYKVLFIPIGNNIDTVEFEWKWHYK